MLATAILAPTAQGSGRLRGAVLALSHRQVPEPRVCWDYSISLPCRGGSKTVGRHCQASASEGALVLLFDDLRRGGRDLESRRRAGFLVLGLVGFFRRLGAVRRQLLARIQVLRRLHGFAGRRRDGRSGRRVGRAGAAGRATGVATAVRPMEASRQAFPQGWPGFAAAGRRGATATRRRGCTSTVGTGGSEVAAQPREEAFAFASAGRGGGGGASAGRGGGGATAVG